MARTYNFDHFNAAPRDQAERDVVREQDKEHLAHGGGDGADDDAKFHYGRRFAETEELLAARQMNAQLEELAGLERAQPTPTPGRREEKRPRKERELPSEKERAGAAKAGRGQPIGSLPPTQERPPMEGVRALVDEATGQFRLVRTAARDLGQAVLRLTRLPMRAVQLLARRLTWSPV